jgi:hypothetical protein
MLLGAEDLRLEVEVSGPVDGELAVAASRSRPVEQVRAFLGWVGEGRALTQTGRVRLADLRELVGLPEVGRCTAPRIREQRPSGGRRR